MNSSGENSCAFQNRKSLSFQLSPRIQEWESLLEALSSSVSPVGTAIQWANTHGPTSGPFWKSTNHGKRSKVCELHRFVPDVLAPEVLFVENGQLGNCMWIQTLPLAVQANILTFLSVEHLRFRPDDLESLARNILSSAVRPDFWVVETAQTLLSRTLERVGKMPLVLPEMRFFRENELEMLNYNSLPDWVDEYVHQNKTYFDFLPSVYDSSKVKETCNEDGKSPVSDAEVDNVKRAHSKQGQLLNCEDVQPETGEVMGGFSPQSSDLVQDPDAVSMNSTLEDEKVTMEGGDSNVKRSDEKEMQEILGVEVFCKAKSLQQDLMMHQESSLPVAISLIRSSLHVASLLAVMKASVFTDEITLLMAKSLLLEKDGYSWANQILKSILLPKLLLLDRTPSRLLVSSLLQAGKTHPRATVDSVILPVIYSRSGPSNFQCEAINRVVKECLPTEVTSFLCQKMFANWEERVECPGEAISTSSWIWTEGLIGVVQNLLQDLDDETSHGLVAALDGAVTDFATSLKFGNLLLNLVSKHASKVNAHKGLLLQIAEQTKTFLTNTILKKLLAL